MINKTTEHKTPTATSVFSTTALLPQKYTTPLPNKTTFEEIQYYTTEKQPIISSGTIINDLSSSMDFNDISDENLDKPKRYTISAAKNAGNLYIKSYV